MSIDASSFATGARRETPQEPPTREKMDLKPSHVRCSYCKSWADIDAAAKQKYKCLNCGAPLEVKAMAEKVQGGGDFGTLLRHGEEVVDWKKVAGTPPEPPSIRISNE